MSKKQLNNRLESLFVNLQDHEEPLAAFAAEALPNWQWVCDVEGRYISISNGVKDCLGLNPDFFLEQSLMTCALDPSSTDQVQNAIMQGVFPIEVEVYYQSAEGAFIPIRLSISQNLDHDNQPSGYHGYAQMLDKQSITSTFATYTPSSSSTPGTKPFPIASTPFKLHVETGDQNVRGVAIEKGKIRKPEKAFSLTGRQLLRRAASHTGTLESMKAIAVPLNLRDQGTGLIEIFDESRERGWTEDERQLVQEISDQLSLALENARLYAAVEQELKERVKVEEEILRRNRDLATLNQIGQTLSKLAAEKEVYELVFRTIGELKSNRNFTLALFDRENRVFTYPVATENGEIVNLGEKPYGNGLSEYVLEHNKILLINEKVEENLSALHIDYDGVYPASLIALPMIAGERPVGAIILKDPDQTNAFSEMDTEILTTVASQTTTALENANLFLEIRTALETIENRERYQASIAKAIAAFSEFGTRAIPSVLAALGQAAKASRVYYAMVKEDERGQYWNMLNQWVDDYALDSLEKSKIMYMPVALFPFWAGQLREKGFCAGVRSEMPALEQEYLRSQNLGSSLLIAVPGKNATPNFIAFDQLETERPWQPEEIAILRLVADALANTIIREDLLEQLQASLDETEDLYNASHRLAMATSFDDMVSAVISGVHSPLINRAALILFDFDSANKINSMRVTAVWHSGLGTTPPEVGSEFMPGTYETTFLRQSAIFYDDLSQAGQEMPTRELFVNQNVHAMGILPLWAGKRQVGVLLVMSDEKYHFSGREQRSYPPLVDQMGTSIENQRLFEQTQLSLAETELLYKVSSSLSQAKNSQELVEIVAQNVMPHLATRASLVSIHFDPNNEPIDLELVGAVDLRDETIPLGQHFSTASMTFLNLLGDSPSIISDIAHADTLDETSKETLTQRGISSGAFVPLRSEGRLIGVLIISAQKPVTFDADEVKLFQIVGNSISVVLERQRLLDEAQRRALELQTAAEIARDTTSTLSLDALLDRIVNQIAERFNYSHAAIYIPEESGESMVIREATGEAGAKMKERSESVRIGSYSVIGTAAESGDVVLVGEASSNPLFQRNDLLPQTQSELALPLKRNDVVVGILDIQSDKTNAFNPDDVIVLQILADQITVAIQNAESYGLSEQAVDSLREADRVKSQFLANMSHELRTPLNSIIGFSRVILKGIDGPVNDTQKQDLTAIYNSGQHLLGLINQILDLSKIEAGKMELQLTETNMIELVNSVLSTAKGLIKDKPIDLKVNLPETLPVVMADQTRIRQVLINFLSNAAKFTDEGDITVEAYTSRDPDGNPEVVVAVTDSGPGIAEQDRSKLFLPFSQVDDSPTRKTGGTGLGLSICRSFIEMHHGRIGLLWSEVGVGSTFFFALKLEGEKEQATPIVEVTPQQIVEKHTGMLTPPPDAPIVLCVDDDRKILALYERYLKPGGYRIETCNDPLKAVEMAKQIKPFAITLDVMMPNKDGWSVLTDLKNDPETRNIPVMMCSILEEEEKGFNLGAVDYLVKPFLQDDLIYAINRLNKGDSVRKVLLIEDSPDDTRLIEKLFAEQHHFQLLTASNGREGIERIEEEQPDVVILDLFLPDMDGFSILEALRADERYHDLQVIVLTGADLTAEQHQLLAEFGQQMINKAIAKPTDLFNAVETALHHYSR